MNLLKFCWMNRQGLPHSLPRALKIVAKRVFNAPSLLRIAFAECIISHQGGFLESPAIVPLKALEGKRRFLKVGKGSVISESAEINLHASVTIGSNVAINSGVIVMTASHDLLSSRWKTTMHEVVIEDFAWIAKGAMILPGVTIGRGAVVGAGAVIRTSVPPLSISIGNPSIVLSRTRVDTFQYSPVEFHAAIEAWIGDARNKDVDISP